MNRTLKIAALSLLTLAGPLYAQAAEHTVNMVDDEMTNAFEPRKLTIKVPLGEWPVEQFIIGATRE